VLLLLQTFSKTATTGLNHHLQRYHPSKLDVGNKSAATPPTFEKEKADMLLARCISDACLALRLVDNEFFKEFVDYLHPGYTPPNRQKLSSKLIPLLFANMSKQVNDRIKDIPYLCFTVDGWKGKDGLKYFALCVHGIDSNFEMISAMLDLQVNLKEDSGLNLSDIVRSTLTEWGIAMNRILAGTTDGASNVQNTVERQLGLPWIYCAAHIVNVAVRTAIVKYKYTEVVNDAKKVCKYIRNSSRVAEDFRAEQLRLDPSQTPLKLKLETKTRWNSCYEMISRMLRCRSAIALVLSRSYNTRSTCPDMGHDKWNSLEFLHQALQPAKDLTDLLSSEAYPTISIVQQLLVLLRPSPTSTNAPTSQQVLNLQVAIAQHVELKWKKVMALDEVKIATFLDPRSQADLPPADRDRAIQCLVEMEEEASRTTSTPSRLTSSSSNGQIGQQANGSRYAVLLKAPRASEQQGIQHEINLYRAEPCVALLDKDYRVVSPLPWWKFNSAKYPILAERAKRYLALMATSVPCERLFSKAAWIQNKRRCSLSPLLFKQLTFISFNHRLYPA